MNASRPSYHFTPPAAWLNDPNGLVYHNGEYHLFYQYHPDSLVWGPMHWGHAVSRDLLTWEHLPIALYPDELGMIFSGSAVIDMHNTAGFGAGSMVAIFTHHMEAYQAQSLAYSRDNGRTWTKYTGNPVLKAPPNLKDFRDPKVFWYDDKVANTGHWVMVLAGGNAVLFYTSPDLKTWKASGGFGFGYGSTQGVWETPELFQLSLDRGSETRWVLMVAVWEGAPARGSGVQYFIGDFDGKTFTTSAPKEQVLWADYGADFYAPQLWNDAPNGRRIGIAWVNNWAYARLTPAETFRGAFTVPREFSLVTTADGIRLVQQPLPELQTLRSDPMRWDHTPIHASAWTVQVPHRAVEIIAQWHISSTARERLMLILQWGEEARVEVGYNVEKRTLFVDRTQAGEVGFHPTFGTIHHAPLTLRDNTLHFHLLIDRQMLELFADEGRVTFTEQIFPPDAPLRLEIGVDRGEIQMTTLEIHSLNAIPD